MVCIAAVQEERQAERLGKLDLGNEPALLDIRRREVAIEVQAALGDGMERGSGAQQLLVGSRRQLAPERSRSERAPVTYLSDCPAARVAR